MFEFGQFAQYGFVIGRELLRHFNVDLHKQVALAAVARIRHSASAQAKHFSAGGPGGDFQFVTSVEGGDFQGRPERRLGITDRDLADQVVAIAVEEGVFGHVNEAVAVSGRSAVGASFAFSLESQPGPVVNAGGDTDFPFDPLSHQSIPTAVEAGVANDGSASLAGGAGGLDREDPRRLDDASLAATIAALFRLGSRFCTGPAAVVAWGRVG